MTDENRSRRPAADTHADDIVVTFTEFLADPLIHLMMQADGVDPQQLARLIGDLGASVNRRPNSEVSDGYRRGVGIMLLNDRNEVFVGRRIDHDGWQMPQGGIEKGEEPRAAAFRELLEEIGCSNAEVIAESSVWLQYDVPLSQTTAVWRGTWRGQRQKWFVMRFNGNDAEINVATTSPEFSNWRWVKPEVLPTLAVDFKRDLYSAVLTEFEPGIIAEGQCPFCAIAETAIVARNAHAFLIYDAAPATPLHMLAIPVRHVSSFFDLTREENAAINHLIHSSRDEIRRQDRSVTGFNVGASDGADAGQTIFHCHYHLLPRRPRDVANPREGIRAIVA